jgi:hypothetical protein
MSPSPGSGLTGREKEGRGRLKTLEIKHIWILRSSESLFFMLFPCT